MNSLVAGSWSEFLSLQSRSGQGHSEKYNNVSMKIFSIERRKLSILSSTKFRYAALNAPL
jgi:hypothetical protein